MVELFRVLKKLSIMERFFRGSEEKEFETDGAFLIELKRWEVNFRESIGVA
jgi:hypothetical protein